ALPKRSQHRRPSPERASDQEKDNSPEHRHDPSRRLSRRVEAQGLSEELTEQGTADPEQGRHDETVRVLPGQNESCNKSPHKADDDRPEDVHSEPPIPPPRKHSTSIGRRGNDRRKETRRFSAPSRRFSTPGEAPLERGRRDEGRDDDHDDDRGVNRRVPDPLPAHRTRDPDTP